MNDTETAKAIIAAANTAWYIAPKENVEPFDLIAAIAKAIGQARDAGKLEAPAPQPEPVEKKKPAKA